MSMNAPGQPPELVVSDPEEIADHERIVNEKTFSRIAEEFELTSRKVNYLEQALHSAQARKEVLKSAMDVLNQPANAKTIPTASDF